LGGVLEHPRLGRLELRDVAAMVLQEGLGRLDVPAAGHLQLVRHVLVGHLLAQRLQVGLELLAALLGLGVRRDPGLQLRDLVVALLDVALVL